MVNIFTMTVFFLSLYSTIFLCEPLDRPVTYLYNTLHYYNNTLAQRQGSKKKLVSVIIGTYQQLIIFWPTKSRLTHLLITLQFVSFFVIIFTGRQEISWDKYSFFNSLLIFNSDIITFEKPRISITWWKHGKVHAIIHYYIRHYTPLHTSLYTITYAILSSEIGKLGEYSKM